MPDEEGENMGLDDEYVEMDSIDEKMIKMHHKYVSDFVIRNDNQNEEEILKIQKFMQSNPNMLLSDNKIKMDKSGDANDDINLNIENKDENENERENEEDENESKNNEDNNKSKSKSKKNEPEKIGIELYEQNIDIEKAFEKHDRIARTPPGELK